MDEAISDEEGGLLNADHSDSDDHPESESNLGFMKSTTVRKTENELENTIDFGNPPQSRRSSIPISNSKSIKKSNRMTMSSLSKSDISSISPVRKL